jgi:hypothetical protein
MRQEPMWTSVVAQHANQLRRSDRCARQRQKKSPPGYAPDGDHAHRITPSEESLARGGGAITGRRRVGERTL